MSKISDERLKEICFGLFGPGSISYEIRKKRLKARYCAQCGAALQAPQLQELDPACVVAECETPDSANWQDLPSSQESPPDK